MQGYGLFTLEEMIYSPTGTVFSRGPGVYKIPGFADIPGELNVSLLRGAPNPRAVYSSKAVGEPPLFLASSIFFAIKEAVKDARKEEGLTDWFEFHSPATSARIRMACTDRFTNKVIWDFEKLLASIRQFDFFLNFLDYPQFAEPEAGSFVPWNMVP